jgi:hypothetical protein
MTEATVELNEAQTALEALIARRRALIAELSELRELLPEATLRRDRAAALLRTSEPEPSLPAHYAQMKTRVEKAPRQLDPRAFGESPPLKV